MVYLKSVENVITLGKLIGLLFLFCLPILSILFLKTHKIRGGIIFNSNIVKYQPSCGSNVRGGIYLIII